MSNVLSDEKKQQVIALGKLGRTLRRIEQTTGVRRETASRYLKGAGIGVRPAWNDRLGPRSRWWLAIGMGLHTHNAENLT
jgi:hypothetical protein